MSQRVSKETLTLNSLGSIKINTGKFSCVMQLVLDS